MEKMTYSIPLNTGVDISKLHLDVHIFPIGVTGRFANDEAGHKALVKWLQPHTTERIVYEATGIYHRHFERALDHAGLPMVKINPRQARRFAQAAGKLAKTDRCDAAMLARYGAALQPEPRPVVSQAIDEMRELLVARDALVKERSAAECRLEGAFYTWHKRQLAQTISQINRQIEAVEKRQKEVTAADADLAQKAEILKSIPGIKDITANVLLSEMPELGTLDEGEVASLAGLAPVANDSGKSSGKRFIKGGRARLRCALFYPAMAAIRCNLELKAKYNAMRKAGKPFKVALTAIMRKLIILANALLRDKRKWTPECPGKTA